MVHPITLATSIYPCLVPLHFIFYAIPIFLYIARTIFHFRSPSFIWCMLHIIYTLRNVLPEAIKFCCCNCVYINIAVFMSCWNCACQHSLLQLLLAISGYIFVIVLQTCIYMHVLCIHVVNVVVLVMCILHGFIVTIVLV